MPRTAHPIPIVVLVRRVVGIVSVEKSAAAALSITSAVRTNAVTHRMAIATIALYSRLQPL